MVPIGIVTRNRVAYLDVTLRSLSATSLAGGTPVIIFDDASNDKTTKRYYNTNKQVDVTARWPEHKIWREELGLHVINDSQQLQIQGIKDKVPVHMLASNPLGVVNASCEAVRQLFLQFPTARGVVLLQDDVIFHADWFARLLDTAQRPEKFTTQKLGLLAGIKLNHTIAFEGPPPAAVATGITAQCLYISRRGFESLQATYFARKHKAMRRFDDTLRRAMAGQGLWAGVIYPFVCQHFGVQSLVRPTKKWSRGRRGRVGFYAHPPYALADSVADFRGRRA